MAKLFLLICCFSVLYYQVQSQILGPIEAARNFLAQPGSSYVIDPPYNPLPPSVAPTSTTIITDCTPSTCKNLANTLQLMIVANLLQNTNGGSDLALQMAAPLISELFSSNTLSCGCANPLAAPGILSPNGISPSLISPNLISPNLISPNLISPNLISPNLISPSVNFPGLISPNVVPSNLIPNNISPNLVSSLVNAIAAGGPGVLSYF